MAADHWWRGAVIYQIYPRSFADSNNDGVGDLPGVAERLDHVASLGVDGIWLSPFFKSPMKDFGYDVADYRDIDPLFGTLADFDALRDRARARGLKIIIDQVYSHSSDQHPWFMESRKARDGARADWYVWADARDDGGPPNNWLSIFGGPAWTWDARRRQYYMHNFLVEQPDLNFHQPQVRAEILDVAKFWLDRGVDGFRLDVANFYHCDRLLRDNPPKRPGGGFARPYNFQRHLYDKSQPENLLFMEELRRLMDRYPDRMAVAEIGSDSYIERSIEYTALGRLHTAYNFMFLENAPVSAKLIREAFETWADDTAWPSWSFSNHDVVRVRSRWRKPDAGDAFAQMLLGLLMCLRGTIFLFQGEELGLPQADVPFEKLQDPEGKTFWPENLGRDGCRTPMPWRAEAPNAGFSDVEPWLPVDPRHHALAVDRQAGVAGSTLERTKKFIATRRGSNVLRLGGIRFLDAPDDIVLFERDHEGERLLCAFNLGAEARTVAAPAGARMIDYGLPAEFSAGRLLLPPFGGAVLKTAP